MIHSLHILHPENTPIGWLGKVPSLKEPREFTFSPGLNILWGQNGSGKSTLLNLLARVFHCEQSGYPVITQSSVSKLCEKLRFSRSPKKDRQDLINSIRISHDGQGVRFIDPAHSVGIEGSSFDNDFLSEGIQNTLFRGSSGQTTFARMKGIILECVHQTPSPAIKYNITKTTANDLWGEWIDIADELLKANSEPGPATILMDEPDRSIDLPAQVHLWRFIRAVAKKAQILVASHSLFALNLPEAKYIELEHGYMGKSRKCLETLQKWTEESPTLPDPAKLPKLKK